MNGDLPCTSTTYIHHPHPHTCQAFFVGFFPLYVLFSGFEWEHYASKSLSPTPRWLISVLIWPLYSVLFIQVFRNGWAYNEGPHGDPKALIDPNNHGTVHAQTFACAFMQMPIWIRFACASRGTTQRVGRTSSPWRVVV